MKYFFTLLIIFSGLGISAQNKTEESYGKALAPIAEKGYSVSKGCGLEVTQRINIDVPPILIVDGHKMGISSLHSVPVNNILSMTVTTPEKSVALFGPEGKGGVIQITLKKTEFATIVVLDSVDRKPLAYANISFVLGRDTLRYVADSAGRIQTNSSLHLEGKEMVITMVGYKPMNEKWTGPGYGIVKEVLMKREALECDEVVLSVIHCSLKRKSLVMCRLGKIGEERSREMFEIADKVKGSADIKMYPNPVWRGNVINIDLSSFHPGKYAVKIFSMHGQLIHVERIDTGKGRSKHQVSLLPGWSTGTYMVHIIDEKNKAAGSGKIVIQ